MASPRPADGLPPRGGRKGGMIPENLQAQAKKIDSPVVNELLVSARKGYTAEVARLLREGGAVVCDKHGRNCLHLACYNGHLDTTLVIIQSRLVDINSANKRGLTALHDACNQGHIAIIHLLLAMGANILSRTKEDWTCLMGACSNGHLDIAKILISAGCDVESTTKHGYTALHVAAWKGKAAVVEMLIEAGSNPVAKAYNNKTPLQLAQEEEQHQCIAILKLWSKKHEHKVSSTDSKFESHQHEIAHLKQEHETEVTQLKQQIYGLEQLIAELKEKAFKDPGIKMEAAALLDTFPAQKKKHKQKNDKGSSDKEEKGTSVTVSPTQTHAYIHRSASLTNLTELEDQERTVGPAPSRPDKMSMVDLVAESLKNPGTMAAIRKELKAAALTPKIQRKFAPKPPSTLPSIATTSSSGETSPRGTYRMSARKSPQANGM